MNSRISYIDALRGFAIILVVIGHLVQNNYSDAYHNSIFNVIYSIHMPLFFFISGCVTKRHIINTESYSCENNSILSRFRKACLGGGIKLANKAFALILPSILWTVLVPNYFSNFSISESISNFWFLNTLFVVLILWEFIQEIIFVVGDRYKYFVMGVISVAFIFLFVIGISRFTIMYFIMFIIGYLTKRYNLIEHIPSWIISILCIMFLLFVSNFSFGSNASGDPERIFWEFPLSIMASIVLLYVFSKFESKTYLYKGVEYIGKFTLGIYVCHFYFVNIPSLEGIQSGCTVVSQIFILAAIAVLICFLCILIEKFIQPITYLYKAMYGKFKI